MLNSTMIEMNNHGCRLVEKGQLKAALSCFKRVLSSFRASAQEEVERRQDGASSANTEEREQSVDSRVLPLTQKQERMIQSSLLPSLASVQETCSLTSERCSIHCQAFPMLEDCSFSDDRITNNQIHVAIVLFNLALSFHRSARSRANTSHSPPAGLSQARALYGHALKVLQGVVDASSPTLCEPIRNRKHLASSSAAQPQRSGNDFVDYLMMAILNNTAVLCCEDFAVKEDQSVLSSRNASFVRCFALFVKGARTQRCYWLGNAALALFEKNAMSLGLLFVRGCAAPAA